MNWDVITTRIILNSLLTFGLLIVSISLWRYKQGNGIARAMSLFTFMAMLHGPFLLLVLGIMVKCTGDKQLDVEFLDIERLISNWIGLIWLASGFWLVYLLLRNRS